MSGSQKTKMINSVIRIYLPLRNLIMIIPESAV
jgi:hypothetical protein